jgi:ATP-dependent Clp protease adapter protein ClpS
MDHWGLERSGGWVDLGGSSSLNLLIGGGDGRLVVRVHRAHVEHDAVMDSWERLEAGMPLLARVHDLLRTVEVGAAGHRPRFANHLEPADVMGGTRRGTARIRGWGPTAEEAGLAAAADRLAGLLGPAEAGLAAELPRQLVHGDLWDDNVLFRHGRPVLLVDFDFMGERARIDDLALTLHCASSDLGTRAGAAEDRARLRRLVVGYDLGLELPLSTAERAALPLAMARQSLSPVAGWVARLDDEATARPRRHPRTTAPGVAPAHGRSRPLAGRLRLTGRQPVRPGWLLAVPVDRGGGPVLPVLAQQRVADAVVDGAVLGWPAPAVVRLLHVAAAAQHRPHGPVVPAGLGLDAPDPRPAAEHLPGQPAHGGGAEAGAPVALGDAQVPARVPGGVEVVDPQQPDHQAVPLQPPGAAALAVQVPTGDQLARLGRGEPGPHMERPAVRAQELGQGVPVGDGHRPVGRLGHGRMVARCATMSRMSTTAPTRERTTEHDDVVEPDIPWVVIVWNDPVNLMSYVVFVLQKLFGYDREKATRLMLDVHHKGKAVVSSGPREKAEFDVYRLHGHGLWATMQKDR